MATIITDLQRREFMARSLLAGAGAVAALGRTGTSLAHGGEVPRVTVWRTADCECCARWAAHLQNFLFVVETREVPDLRPVRAALGVPPPLAGCHIARIDDYLIEGHVPASDIHRLLAERPPARGLAVPGMPKGSPGMDVEPGREPFDVLLFQADGRNIVYNSYH